ncbi:MAG TPA: hypothetical protein VEQ60_21785 [Longimicrobium sp.]|nr:hypothetical protein [Longimicrobium sp.]
MSNLTLDENLIRPHKPEPLEGHTVVVLERVGEEGEKFHSLLEPGAERPRQGLIAYLLGKPNVYFAFAVDASKHRALSFSEQVEMAERPHNLELHFSLWYRAADPELLVASRTTDPLARVRRKVAEVITEEMAELPWDDVRHAFRAASSSVVSGTLPELKSFARDYGIAITSITLRGKFPPGAIAADTEIHAVREKGRVVRARMEVGEDLKNHRSNLRRENAGRDEEDRADAARREFQDMYVREMKDRVGGLIREAPGIVELGDLQRGISGMTGLLGHPSSNGPAAIGAGNGHPQPVLPPGGSGLPAVLAELVTLTQLSNDGQTRLVRGSLLHVVAEVVANDSSQVSAALADYARQARTAITDASPPADRLQALRALADPQQLRQRLYP